MHSLSTIQRTNQSAVDAALAVKLPADPSLAAQNDALAAQRLKRQAEHDAAKSQQLVAA